MNPYSASRVIFGEEERRALQSAQGQPRVARRDGTLRQLARKVCVAERYHVTERLRNRGRSIQLYLPCMSAPLGQR